MNRMKVWMGVFSALLMLVGAVAPAHADSHGTLAGYVTGQAVYYWQGNVNMIDLSFDTQDGIIWTLRCRRANANLGLCSNILQAKYTAEGTFSSNSILELESMTH